MTPTALLNPMAGQEDGCGPLDTEAADRLAAIITYHQSGKPTELDLPALMTLIVERTQQLTRADGAVVALAEGGEMVWRVGSGSVLPHLGLRLPVAASLSGVAVRQAEALLCNDTAGDPRVDPTLCRRLEVGSLLVAPLRYNRRLVGVLQVVSTRPGAFDERDLRSLQLMAGSLGSAMSHAATAFEARLALVTERNAALATLHESEMRFRSAFDCAAIGMGLVSLEGQWLQVNRALCALLGHAEAELLALNVPLVTHPDDVDADADLLRLLEEGALSDYQIEKRFLHQMGYDVWVQLSVSLVSDEAGRPHYFVYQLQDITDRKDSAGQIASYTEELTQKNAHLEANLQLAREVQLAFLPPAHSTFPRSMPASEAAVRFHHRYYASAGVGGDFYDLLPLSDTCIGVFICDVMGHDVRSALVTAMVRAMDEELMAVASDAGQFLTEINRGLLSILRRSRSPLFASAFYLVADVAAGEVRYATAGHPSPLLVHREKRQVESLSLPLAQSGPALGVFEEFAYESCSMPLTANDLILLFTDGLYEVQSPEGQDYGVERLMEAVHIHTSLPVPRLFDELVADINRFSQHEEFEDDVCLVGMEVLRLGLAAGRQRRHRDGRW